MTRSARAAVMFSKASDEWATPQDCYDALHREFHFQLDAAAVASNAKCDVYLGPDHVNPLCSDALVVDWREVAQCNGAAPIVWLNPPYSQCRQFIAKAAEEGRRGCTVVCLIPSRTDTRWWGDHVWDYQQHRPRPGVEVRFLKGRLKFGNSANSAPFPSVIVIFRPTSDSGAAVEQERE